MSNENFETTRRVAALTIAGSDSGGNAGIQADLRAFHVFGVHGCTAITALTAQNPFGVDDVLVASGAFVGQQLDTVLGVYGVSALKTGMLASAEIIEVVAGRLLAYGRILKVVDPVMIATSGAKLLADDAMGVMAQKLLPLATLITPNLPEAEVLLDTKIEGHTAAVEATRALYKHFGVAVLLKGGHRAGQVAYDLLYDGTTLHQVATPRLAEPLSTHGTGCSLSAAITAALASGKNLLEAVLEGKAYVYESIRSSVWVGEVATVLGTPRSLPHEIVSVTQID